MLDRSFDGYPLRVTKQPGADTYINITCKYRYLKHFLNEFRYLLLCLLQGRNPYLCCPIILPRLTINDFIVAFYISLALKPVQYRIERAWAEIVAMSGQLFLDSGAKDGFFSGMMQNMDTHKSKEEVP